MCFVLRLVYLILPLMTLACFRPPLYMRDHNKRPLTALTEDAHKDGLISLKFVLFCTSPQCSTICMGKSYKSNDVHVQQRPASIETYLAALMRR